MAFQKRMLSESGEGGKQHENDVTESKEVAPSQITSALNMSSSQTSRVVLSKMPSIAPSKVDSFLDMASSLVPSSVLSPLPS
eukprot:9882929-Ditylum_brightwellii.AAC.1